MDQIHVDKEKLKDKISQLKELKSECDRINTKPQALSGGGTSVNALANIDEEYDTIRDAMGQLIENAVGFFENVLNSVTEADEVSSEKLS